MTAHQLTDRPRWHLRMLVAARGALPSGAVPLRVLLTFSGAHVGDLVVARSVRPA